MTIADPQLILGDCLDVMPTLATASVDLILCDLPYGTTQNKWDAIIPLEPLWAEYRRVCKPGAAIVLTAAQPFTSVLVCSNLRRFSHAWVWHKTRKTGHLNAKKQPLKVTEDVLVFRPHGHGVYNPQGIQQLDVPVFRQGSTRTSLNWGAQTNGSWQTHTGYPTNVITIPSEPSPEHPTQKPVALMEYLIRTYTNPGDTVLDNCMGSGTTGVACVSTGRGFIGVERDVTYFEIAQQRIANAQPPQDDRATRTEWCHQEESAAVLQPAR